MLVDLFMFVLVRSGEEPLVGTQTPGSSFTNELQKSRRNHRSNVWTEPLSGILIRTSFSGYATHGSSLASLDK